MFGSLVSFGSDVSMEVEVLFFGVGDMGEFWKGGKGMGVRGREVGVSKEYWKVCE